MRDKIEYFLASSLISITKIIPNSWIYTIFKYLAITLFYVDRKRQKLTIKNLSYLYQDENLKELAKNNFIEISKTLAETLIVSKLSKDEILSMLDTSMLQSTNLPKDKSYIFLTAHIGNWELLGYIFTLNGYILNILAREGNNSLIEKNITLNSRHRFGAKTIYKKRAGISFVRALKRGESVGVLIDQKAGLVNGVMTKFFDRDVTTASLIANIKLKLDVDIVPLFLVRDGNKFKLIIRDKIEYKAEEIENQNDKIVAMTQRYNDEIERIVREYPMQWFWMHNRWKI